MVFQQMSMVRDKTFSSSKDIFHILWNHLLEQRAIHLVLLQGLIFNILIWYSWYIIFPVHDLQHLGFFLGFLLVELHQKLN